MLTQITVILIIHC